MRTICALGITLLMLAPTSGSAQSLAAGTIGGVVRDTTGAVLPGVTVEASSPALIERVRTVVTDDQGQYKIVDLRPGTYTVAFSLPGFSIVKREGIELTTAFTATINAELRVGSLEETVTVTGASPVVDVQNVRSKNVVSRQILESVPIAGNTQGFAALTLGANLTVTGGTATSGVGSQQDVGGNKGDSSTSFSVHGTDGNDMKLRVDGMVFNNLTGAGGGVYRVFRVNLAMAQEVVMETAGMSAESETGGVQFNVVPREGGDQFRGTIISQYTNNNFQADNLTPELRARGLNAAATVRKIYEYNGGIGGPLQRGRMWFFAAARASGAQENQPGSYYNKLQGTLFYTPDLSQPGYTDPWYRDLSVRVTWQAARNHKINLSHSYQNSCNCKLGVSAIKAPEAVNDNRYWPRLTQATWNYPATHRLFLEGGATYNTNPQIQRAATATTAQDYGVLEASTGLSYGSSAAVSAGSFGRFANYTYSGLPNSSDQFNGRVSFSYVTGSHAFRTGLTLRGGWSKNNTTINHDLSYTFRNQLPISITQYASPFQDEERLWPEIGIFGQDQWTLSRVTLNLGIRYDGLKAYDPAFHYAGGRFVPAYDFAAISDVPNWKDITPRVGVAYDVFGNGKTAIKAALGRYVGAQGVGLALANHPAVALVLSATRTWNDANGNFIPDCELTVNATNGECGALSNNNFGKSVINTRYADDLLRGWGNRPYNWQTLASVQQELWSRTALNVGYFRTSYGNFSVTDNLLVTPQDFTPYCFTAPADARLPGGGGNRICGLYDVVPAKFGQVSNVVTLASNFGKRKQIYDGADISINARFGKQGLLTGGVNVGRTVVDMCATADAPQIYCDAGIPWQSQIKIAGVYPLPLWGLSASATLQNVPGAPRSANYPVPNALIAPALGRNLAACPATGTCTATATVPLIQPYTTFEDRLNQLDVRLTKMLRVSRYQLQGNFDIYNLFNAGTVLSMNTTYGSSWLQPTAILSGRLIKFSGQLNF